MRSGALELFESVRLNLNPRAVAAWGDVTDGGSAQNSQCATTLGPCMAQTGGINLHCRLTVVWPAPWPPPRCDFTLFTCNAFVISVHREDFCSEIGACCLVYIRLVDLFTLV